MLRLRSGHDAPVAYATFRDDDRDLDDIAEHVTQSYHRHVERYLATTSPPTDVEAAVSSGLLASLLLGRWTEYSADWCHAAWNILRSSLGGSPSQCRNLGSGLDMVTCVALLIQRSAAQLPQVGPTCV